MSKKRIGILTSGGDCPGLNAVIRGAVKASHQLGYDCVGFLKGYEGLYDPVQYVHLTPNSTRGILNQGGTILGSTNKGRFAATVGVQDRQELDPELIEGVKQTIEQLGIDGLICVGGDGSLAVAQQFHENGIPVVGVPKTIDNDLSATAFTFGFDSAIECATDALDRLHTTAASHERIMVLEVMGRHAGWIALHSGIAGGGDVILLPEIEWNWEHVCHKIMHRESQGKRFTLVVVAEGAHLPNRGMVGESQEGQQMKLGGLGREVAEEIERRLHRETRLSVLGHLQRGGKPTTFDRVLATQFGAHAVRLVHQERFGEMICSQPPEMNSVPIMEAVNVLRQVDPHGPAVQAARALGISFGDRPADEIGQNIFDRLEPVAHVEGYQGPDTTVVLTGESEAVEEPTPAVVEAAPSEVEVEVPAETAAVPADEEPAAEVPAAEPTPEVQTPVAEATEVEEQAVEETPAAEEEPCEEDIVAEEIVETVLDLASDTDEMIHGPVEAADLTADEPTPAEEIPAESEAEEAAATEEPAEEPVAESTPVEDSEPEVAEEVAQEPQPTAADEQAAAPLEEIATTDALVAEEPAPTAEVASEEVEPETVETAPEPAAAAESKAEEAAATEEPEEPEATPVNLSDVQSALAMRISEAAKASRDAAPAESVVDSEVDGMTVAELVKQKLAAASVNVKKPTATPEEPVDQPHDEDLVAEARSALEEALVD